MAGSCRWQSSLADNSGNISVESYSLTVQKISLESCPMKKKKHEHEHGHGHGYGHRQGREHGHVCVCVFGMFLSESTTKGIESTKKKSVKSVKLSKK
jgi:hypothetical protein